MLKGFAGLMSRKVTDNSLTPFDLRGRMLSRGKWVSVEGGLGMPFRSEVLATRFREHTQAHCTNKLS